MSYDHEAERDSALNAFQTALTNRWLEEAYNAVVAPLGKGYFVPDSVSERAQASLYDHRSPSNWQHALSDCVAVKWYQEGNRRDASSIICDGRIREDIVDSRVQLGDREEILPEAVDCRIGSLFTSIEDWAYSERRSISGRLPEFLSHDTGALSDAYDTFIQIAGRFGDESGDNSGNIDDNTALSDLVSYLNVNDDTADGWRAEWTGTAADAVAEGFFSTPATTLHNHAEIAAAIASFFAIRARILVTARRNTLEVLGAATSSLDETVENPIELDGLWKTLEITGKVVSKIVPALSAVEGVSAAISFLGEELFKDAKQISYAHSIYEVLTALGDDADRVMEENDRAEGEYLQEVNRIREDVNAVPSFLLELYDITENNPGGTERESSEW